MYQCEMGLSIGRWHVLATQNFVLLNLLPLHIMEDGLLLWTLAKSPDITTAVSRRCLPPTLPVLDCRESEAQVYS